VHGHQPRDQTAFRNPDRNLVKAVVLGHDAEARQAGAALRLRCACRQRRKPSAAAALLRKANLAPLPSRRVMGIFIAEYEQGDIGDVLFRVTCNMDLEGIVSKHLDRAYSAGKMQTLGKGEEPGAPRVRQ
jgi:hypothetical protein